MQCRIACQTVERSAHAKAALPYRVHNAMTASALIAAFAKRVLTMTTMVHAVDDLPGIESILSVWYRVLEAA